MNTQDRNRLVLIALLLMFAAPLLIAYVMNHEGWHPQQTRNSGTLVEPPRDISTVVVTLADGSKLVWRDPQWHWTLLALPGAACSTQCRMRLDETLRMRLTLGRNAERVRVVYLGPALPAADIAERAPLLAGQDDGAALAAYRAHDGDNLALALVDPNGLLMLHYPEGYSAQGLRSDIQKVLH
jgi:cytochrome oxidase Cu insertion factor (SCO1/SenC/PrrC family)